MKSSLETVMSFTGFCALGALSGYLFGKKHGLTAGEKKGFERGRKEGAKAREDEILNEFVWYVPVGRLTEFAQAMLEGKDFDEDFPLLVIRSDKYDYINGVELEDK